MRPPIKRVEASTAGEPSSQRLDSDDDEPNFLVDANFIMATLDIHILLAPKTPQPDPQGTLTTYTWSLTGTMQRVAHARMFGPDVLGTPGGCCTSVSPRLTPAVPQMEVLDVLDQRTRP